MDGSVFKMSRKYLFNYDAMKALLVSTFVLSLVCPISAATLYTIQHLPGLAENFGASINDHGDVVAGRFLWADGSRQDLGDLGGNWSVAEGINNRRQVVGRTRDDEGLTRAFIWEGGSMRILDGLVGEGGYATAINELGEVVGYSADAPGRFSSGQRATLWTTQGDVVDLGAIGSDRSSTAWAINDSGQIAGRSRPHNSAGFGRGAGLLGADSQEIIFQFSSTGDLSVGDINNHGHVVGYISSAAYLWDGSSLNYIDPEARFSLASGINDSGTIVGRRSTASEPLHAFVYEEGELHQLIDLVENPEEWSSLSIAYDINENGQIVGVGRRADGGNDNEVFLLTPVPEPRTGGLLLLAFGTTTLRLRTRS